MPEIPQKNQNVNTGVRRERAYTSDRNELIFSKHIVHTYFDMGLLSETDKNAAEKMTDIERVAKIIAKVPELSAEQRLVFCDKFVGDDLVNFNGATPAILANAYRAAYAKAKTDDAQKARLQKIAEHIDNMSADFANSGGMIINDNVVDTTNIADVYPGFVDMLHARMGDVDAKNKDARRAEMTELGVDLDDEKIAQMDSNLEVLGTVITEYDSTWGDLGQVTPQTAQKLEKRWDKLDYKIARIEISEETKRIASKYKFLDQDGNVIPQFKSAGRKDDTEYEDYAENRRIIKGGRLDTIIELARHNVAKKHAARFSEKIDADALEREVNDEVVYLLYSVTRESEKANAAAENPEIFIDATKRADMDKTMAQNGGQIPDWAYTATLNAHANATGGWLARIKSKAGATSSKIEMERFFEKASSIGNADARMQKRIELFKRILKGVASAFIASAIITTIATALAATAGMSLAVSAAALGFTVALGAGIVQVNRWRKNHPNATITDFLHDADILKSLGVTAIACIAMCFGAAGMATAAVALGYGALAAGGLKNAHEAYRDARRKMSAVESLAWAIANVGAIIAGGFAGRAVAHMGINAFNQHYQENTLLQEKSSHQELRETTEEVEHTKTVTDYPEEAVPRAEAAMEKWYANDPELLQQRVEAIEAYNAEHGTDINPYRALRVMAWAGSDPSHLSYTNAWGVTHNVQPSDVDLMANIFEPGSAVMAHPEGMDMVQHFDLNHLDAMGHIGGVDGHVLRPNDVYSSLGEMPTQHSETYTTQETVTKTVDVDDYNSVNKSGMAMFGTYNPRERFKKLKSRIGSFVDRVTGRDDSESPQESVIQDEEKRVQIDTPDTNVDEVIEPNDSALPQEPVVKDEERQVQIDTPDTDTINFVPVSDDEILQDLYYRPDDVVDTDEAEIVQPQNDDVVVHEEPENNLVVDVPNTLGTDENIEVIRPQDEAFIEDVQPIEETPAELPPLNLPEPMDEETVQPQSVQTEENTEQVRQQTKEEILGDIISAVAANAGLREKETAEPLQPQEEIVEEVIPEVAEPVSTPAPAKPKDELEDINWARYQHPFTFDHEKIETENPFDIRKDMNLSDNAVRNIDVGALLKKPNSENPINRTIKEPAPEPVPEPAPEPVETIVPEQTPVPKPVSEPMFTNNARTDMLDAAYGKSIAYYEDRKYSVPTTLNRLAQQEDIMQTDVGSFHGTPVKFVDINGNDNPIAQTKNTAVVVVEVGELKIPFYLATGLDGGTRDIPGHWYPASRITADGMFYRPRNMVHNSNLLEIASMLDAKIGDIRNWEDEELTRAYKDSGRTGSIGGCDVGPEVDMNRVYKILSSLVYMQPGPYDNHSVYGTTPESHELSWDDGMISYILRDLSEKEYDGLADRVKENVRTLAKGIRSRFQKVFGGKH